jgi:hypothetical protein
MGSGLDGMGSVFIGLGFGLDGMGSGLERNLASSHSKRCKRQNTVLASVFHGKATDFGELIIHGKRPFTVKICRLEFNSSRMKIWLSR